MKLRKLVSWLLGNAGTWFFRLGILALLGAAITINYVADLVVDSPVPWLIISASLTAILLSLPFIPSIQKKWWGVLGALVLAVAAAAFTWWQLEDSVQSSADPIPPIPFHLNLSFGLTILAAILALVLWVWSGQRVYNPRITLVQNGVTLIGVVASAIAFNLPASWSDGVGWAIIALTLMWLEPIWKSEAAAAAQLESLKAKIVELEAEIKSAKGQKERRLPGFFNLLKRLSRPAKVTKS